MTETFDSGDRLVSRKEASNWLRVRGISVSHRTLAMMAVKANNRPGPPYFKDGHRTVYSINDLREWAKRRLRRVE